MPLLQVPRLAPSPGGPSPGRAVLLAAIVAASAPVSGGEARGRASFHFDIRPLLSDRCFKCHGPDERARQAGLRLDAPESALAPLADGRTAIRPGDRGGSELWRRITASDPSERMPPPDSNLSLTAEETERLGRWIDEGAVFERHWSFIAPREPALPAPRLAAAARGVVRNPIDLFILERLEREGLEPAPEASPETLVRRLTLDLTGLPPTVAEVDAFLADTAPGAHERLVERLLDSPAYGEARALEWLDLARYADTYGYQSDVERDMSPWRDWVIRAFRENLRHDEFITWQIAGDLLPGASRDQVLATAFLRLHRQTNEGGSIEEEFRAEYAADRVHTTGTAFLGLSLECARCHDHKYDPIPQRDYYRLFAFFNNIDESGLYSHFTQATPTPTLLLYPGGAEARHADLRAKLDEAEKALAGAEASAAARFEAWLRAAGQVPAPEPSARYAFDEIAGGASPNAADPSRPAKLSDGPALVEGKRGKALLFSGDNSAVLPGAGAFRRTSPFGLSLWIRPGGMEERAVVLHRSRAWSDSGSRGYELILHGGRPELSLIHFWPGNAASIRALEPLSAGEWTHIAAAHDGSGRASGLRLFVNGERAKTEVVRDHLRKDITHRKEWGDADVGGVELTLAARFRDSGLKGGAIDEVNVFDRDLSAAEARLLAGKGVDPARPEDRPLLLDHFTRRVDAECAAERDRARALREEEAKLADDIPEIMVMREMEPRRPTHLLRRGAYDAPGEAVEPAAPGGIHPFAPDLPRNRLGLARWLVDPRNPLTARVAVNRAWMACFGRGLVATPEDFGSQGRLPSHPELLDWLAIRFVESGWDLKDLFRRIVGSAAYRRSSLASEDSLARDPENILLSRGPRQRLRAEAIRDSALLASGLLSRRIGGPSVKPYQPAGLWEEAGTGKTYVEDRGESLYRRSLYTFWRRTAPPPSMVVFDAPSREVCSARREPTGTPLQALVLLNDPQFVEAARVLAERLAKEHPEDPRARIVEAFRAFTGRRPEPDEAEVLERLFRTERERFASDRENAEKSLAIGEHPRDASVPAAEAAATAAVVTAILSLDEVVTRR